MLLWLVIGLVLVMVLGVVALALYQGDEGRGGREASGTHGSVEGDEDNRTKSPDPAETEAPAAPQVQGEEQKKPPPPVEEGGPQGNDRNLEVPVSPPVESGLEAFAAVVDKQPEARDWYWSVEQPHYQAWDRGDRYLIRLYALLPPEGSLPERSAFFGDYLVIKADAAVSKVD